MKQKVTDSWQITWELMLTSKHHTGVAITQISVSLALQQAVFTTRKKHVSQNVSSGLSSNGASGAAVNSTHGAGLGAAAIHLQGHLLDSGVPQHMRGKIII